MKRLTNGTATFVLLLVLGSIILASAAQARLVRGQQPSYYKKQQSSTEFILEGGLAEPMGDLKDEACLSDSGMSGRKRKLIAEMLEVLGPNCLADAGREPAWRSDVAAQREKDACRHQMAAV